MKILHLIDSGGLFGAEQMLLTLARTQQQSGHHPHIISGGSPRDGEKALETAAAKAGLPVTRWRSAWWRIVLDTYRLISWANSSKFNVVHSHGYKFTVLFTLLRPLIRPAAILTTLHGYIHSPFPHRQWFYERLDRLSLRFVNAVVTVDRQLLKTVQRDWAIDEECMYFVPNGLPDNADVPEESYSKQAVLKEFVDRHDFNIVSIGRLAPEKNIQDVIKSLQFLCKRRQKIGYCIIGSGRLEQELRKTVSELGLDETVMFAGYIEGAYCALDLFDCLAIPSSTEGAPMVILEAMRARVPVIATDVGGVPELLDGGRAGLIVETGNPKSLSRAFERLIDEQPLRDRLVDNAFRRFKSHYSANVMMERYMTVYAALRHSHPAGHVK